MEVHSSLELASLGLSEALVGPFLIGAMVQIGLYGFIISHLINLRSSPTWTRSGRWTRAICYGVVLINTIYTGVACHDIWYYGTMSTRDYDALSDGTIPQSTEPIILSSIAFVVQMTLAVRSSRIMKRTVYRYVYLVLIGCAVVFTLLASVALVAASVKWHFHDLDPHLGRRHMDTSWAGISLRTSLICWMWGSCAIDLTITIVYLTQLRRTLWGRNATSDSVVLVIGRLMIWSASYTAFFAALVAIMAQLYCDSWTLFNVSYAFCLPLGSLYTLSLFTTLTIPDVVERELGGHVTQLREQHPSAILTLSSTGNASNGPILAPAENYQAEEELDKNSQMVFYPQ